MADDHHNAQADDVDTLDALLEELQNLHETAEVTPTAAPTTSSEQAEVIRVLVLGIGSVGKSALIIQFTQSNFVDEYDVTIEDSYMKRMTIPGSDTHVLFQVTDVGGQEEFSALQTAYCANQDGFIIAYAVTYRPSFDAVRSFYDRAFYALMEKTAAGDCTTLPIVLVATKCDLVEARDVTPEEGSELAKALSCPFFESSSRQRINVDEPFYRLADIILRTTSSKARRDKIHRACSIQ